MCTTCVPGAHRGQRKASDLLELELLMVVDTMSYVTAGIEPGSSARQQALFTAEPSLQSQGKHLVMSFLFCCSQVSLRHQLAFLIY